MSPSNRQILDLADTTITSLLVCSPYDVGHVEPVHAPARDETTYFAYFEGEKDPAAVATYEGEGWPGTEKSIIRSASIYCSPSALDDYISLLNAALNDPNTSEEAFMEQLPPEVQPDKINLMAVS